MPDKNRILEYLDELSPAARLIGAVNIVENKEGRLIGHNTDGIGFMRSVKEQGIQMQGENMTLLGMGVLLRQSVLRRHWMVWELFAFLQDREVPIAKEWKP